MGGRKIVIARRHAVVGNVTAIKVTTYLLVGVAVGLTLGYIVMGKRVGGCTL